jgi:hypothetical protein
MRGFALLSAIGLSAVVGLVACASKDDTTTDDSSEINEGRGSIERELTPPIAPPTSPFIGAKLDDVFLKAAGSNTPSAAQKQNDCMLTDVKDATTKKIVVQRVVCASSDTVRVLDSGGTMTAEHLDANKDGKVDRYTGQDGAVSQYEDTNFDGTIDVVVERVDKVTDFSLKGYGENLPKSDFLYRIREDRNHDGKLDHEKLTAKGSLPPSS